MRILARLKKYPAYKVYGRVLIQERHRYEFNNQYRKVFEKKDMIFFGVYPKKNLVEIIELNGHPYFIVVQFHPEFKSKPDKAHPLFREFIKAALKKS